MQRILIVEDEQKTGRYLQQGLVEEGYQADLFNNGRDGLGPAASGYGFTLWNGISLIGTDVANDFQ